MNDNVASWQFKRLWFGGQQHTTPNGAIYRQWRIRMFGREWMVSIVTAGKAGSMSQVSTVIPQLNQGGKRIGGKKPKGKK